LTAQLNLLGGAHQPRGVSSYPCHVRGISIEKSLSSRPSLLNILIFQKGFGVILEQVLEEELGGSLNAEAKQTAWKNGIAAMVAGVSKTLK
jgi:hypothetical protein